MLQLKGFIIGSPWHVECTCLAQVLGFIRRISQGSISSPQNQQSDRYTHGRPLGTPSSTALHIRKLACWGCHLSESSLERHPCPCDIRGLLRNQNIAGLPSSSNNMKQMQHQLDPYFNRKGRSTSAGKSTFTCESQYQSTS